MIEKYGDPAKIVDVVIESIKEVKVIKEGEHKRFINFVNIVEDAYQDLRRLGLEKEINHFNELCEHNREEIDKRCAKGVDQASQL